MLKINGWSKYAEEDSWKDGCLPNTAQGWDVDLPVSGETEQELIENVMRQFDVTRDAIELNACGEEGRIDVAVTENADSSQPSKSEIAEWKRGKRKMWYSVYTGYVVAEQPYTFTEEAAHEHRA